MSYEDAKPKSEKFEKGFAWDDSDWSHQTFKDEQDSYKYHEVDDPEDLYHALDVEPSASNAEIQHSFNRLAKRRYDRYGTMDR